MSIIPCFSVGYRAESPWDIRDGVPAPQRALPVPRIRLLLHPAPGPRGPGRNPPPRQTIQGYLPHRPIHPATHPPALDRRRPRPPVRIRHDHRTPLPRHPGLRHRRPGIPNLPTRPRPPPKPGHPALHGLRRRPLPRHERSPNASVSPRPPSAPTKRKSSKSAFPCRSSTVSAPSWSTRRPSAGAPTTSPWP